MRRRSRSRAFAPHGHHSLGRARVGGRRGLAAISDALLAAGAPVLGICYGMQRSPRSSAARSRRRIIANTATPRCDLKGSDPLLRASALGLKVWMSHGDRVERLPKVSRRSARRRTRRSRRWPTSSARSTALQFHPEVTHTEHGLDDSPPLRARRLRLRAGVDGENIVAEHLYTDSREGRRGPRAAWAFGRRRLVRRGRAAARGDRRPVDLRVRRHGPAAPERRRSGHGASSRSTWARRDSRRTPKSTFLGGLAGVDDPEQKRKIIGRLFVEVFDAEAAKINDVRWLAQGTIYPDVIESAGAKTGKAHSSSRITTSAACPSA